MGSSRRLWGVRERRERPFAEPWFAGKEKSGGVKKVKGKKP